MDNGRAQQFDSSDGSTFFTPGAGSSNLANESLSPAEQADNLNLNTWGLPPERNHDNLGGKILSFASERGSHTGEFSSPKDTLGQVVELAPPNFPAAPASTTTESTLASSTEIIGNNGAPDSSKISAAASNPGDFYASMQAAREEVQD